MKKTHGFTLLEVMITLAIVAILVSVAVPAFFSYKQKGLLGGAQSFMLTVASKEQEYMLTNRLYALDGGGTTGLQKLNITIADEEDINDNFAVTITGDASSFLIKLTPKSDSIMNGYEKGGVTLDAADPLTLNSLDQKAPAAFW